MKIAIGSDHAGFTAKEALRKMLLRAGHRVRDFGTISTDSVDYPDYAALVAGSVAKKSAERGVLVCGTGTGMCIAANKVRGIRAASVWSVQSAKLAAEHNHANVLCLSGRFFPVAKLSAFTRAWLATPFAPAAMPEECGKLPRWRAKSIGVSSVERLVNFIHTQGDEFGRPVA